MRSTIARKALAMVGVAGLGLLVGAAPAFAATEGKAYSKAEVINGSVLGVGVSPVKVEYPPGGTIQQPTIDLGIARVDLVGAGASASGDAAKGQSKAEVNYADATVTVGIPNGPRVVVKESALDVLCTADGGVLNGSMNLVGVQVQVALLPGQPLVNVPIAIDLGKQTGVSVGGLVEVLINKQVRKDGVISVTALSVNVLGAQGVSLEFGKVTCGPNIPEPVTPIGDPVGLGAGGLAMASVIGFGMYRRNKRSALEVS